MNATIATRSASIIASQPLSLSSALMAATRLWPVRTGSASRDQLQFRAAPKLAQALQDDGVARHRQQDQEPEHRVEPELADAEAKEALLERPDHHRAEHGAR